MGKIKRIALLAFLASLTAFAAADSAQLRFMAVASQALSGVVYKHYPAGLDQPPVFESMKTIAVGFSEPFTYMGPPVLEFYLAPVTETSTPMASVNVASLKNGCVFVFFQTREEGQVEPQWNVVPINDMERQCPLNNIVFYNFTKIPLAGKIGETLFRPLPPKTQPLPVRDMLRVDIYSFWQQENRPVPVCTTTLGLGKGSRYFGMFYPEVKMAANGPPRVRFRLIIEVVDRKLEMDRMIYTTTSE